MNTLIKRYWHVIGLLFIVATIVYFVIKAHNRVMPKESALLSKLPLSCALQLKDVHYVHDDPKKCIKWEFDAKKVSFSKDKSIILFTQFSLKIYSKEKSSFCITGKKGKYNRKTNTIFLSGNIKAVYLDSYNLYTEHLIFNEKKAQGYSNDPVYIKGPFFDIKGKGFFLDINRRKIKVLSDVKSVVQRIS